jgi:hypothetical protein
MQFIPIQPAGYARDKLLFAGASRQCSDFITPVKGCTSCPSVLWTLMSTRSLVTLCYRPAIYFRSACVELPSGCLNDAGALMRFNELRVPPISGLEPVNNCRQGTTTQLCDKWKLPFEITREPNWKYLAALRVNGQVHWQRKKSQPPCVRRCSSHKTGNMSSIQLRGQI